MASLENDHLHMSKLNIFRLTMWPHRHNLSRYTWLNQNETP